MKRPYWHMNFCIECKKPFVLKDNPDYCEQCKVIVQPEDYEMEVEEEENIPEIVNIINRRFEDYYAK